MPRDFKLPDLGEGIHEGQVINVMVAEGDRVEEDQMVLEVETDKAALELPVPFAGVITSLNVTVGETVTVGHVLLTVGEAGDVGSTVGKSTAGSAPARGRARATTASGDRHGRATRTPVGAGAALAEPLGPRGPVPAAPAVRRFAREQGIDLRQVRGTGPGGRVVREDVERFMLAGPTGREVGTVTPGTSRSVDARAPVRQRGPAAPMQAPHVPGSAAPGERPGVAPAAEALPDFSQWGPIRRERIPQIRKAISRKMTRAWTTIPHVTHADEADVTGLEAFRKEQGRVFAERGAKLTLTAFLVKAVAGALQEFPQLNASYDEPAAELIHKEYLHVGVAVDTPRGLMVPVLRDVDRKGLAAISAELKDLADRAREFKIDIAEMRGGSFTITNVGALGGTFSTPMINWPEVAILGVGRLAAKPVVRDGQIVPRKILPLFLSFDHRVIDGADGARFLRAVIAFLENPLNLLLVS